MERHNLIPGDSPGGPSPLEIRLLSRRTCNEGKTLPKYEIMDSRMIFLHLFSRNVGSDVYARPECTLVFLLQKDSETGILF